MDRNAALRNFLLLLLAALAAAIFITTAHAGEFAERDGVAPCGASQVFE